MSRLAVKSNNTVFICLLLLALIFGALALGNLLQLRHGFRLAPLIWAVLPIALFLPILWLVRRGHSNSVKIFTEDGLTRNDGYRFSWSELDCVIEQLHRLPNRPADMLWRVEIHFRNGGCAWLIPNKISNRAAVLAYVAALPCEHKTVRV
jgi:hypothetical protein